MFITLTLVSIAFTIQTIYLLCYKRQIRGIGNQLSFILKHESFKLIQLQFKPKEILRLVELCNMMLRHKRELNNEFTEKSEEINATIVSLSHDIRTPITSLDGYLQLAERSEDPIVKARYVTIAQTRVNQIIKLVDELFLYTKLQNPDYVLEFESVDVINVLKRRLFSFIDEFPQNEYEPNINLPDSSVNILGNQGALERIFENIIKNYLLHGEDVLSISYEDKQNEMFIHFSNMLKQGQEINFDMVFNRFYKEDPSRHAHSSGLGLSIVKSLVEKMNGYVNVDLKSKQFCISVAFIKTGKGG